MSREIRKIMNDKNIGFISNPIMHLEDIERLSLISRQSREICGLENRGKTLGTESTTIEQARREERERAVRICEEYANERDERSQEEGDMTQLLLAVSARELARRIGGGE